MIKFDKNDIELINDVWTFLSSSNDDYLWQDALNIESKNLLKGWLLYESERHPDRYFEDLDLMEKAVYVKKGVEKYGK